MGMQVREDDIWLVTYPKCGTTWMQEIVTMLTRDVDQNYGEMPLMLRSPFLEIDSIMAKKDGPNLFADLFKDTLNTMPDFIKEQFMALAKGNVYFANNALEGRRVLKSHYSFDFLPENLPDKCKVVYVARNPLDCCVSYFHHNRDMPKHGYKASFADFAEDFMAGIMLYGDYWSHLESGWKLKDHPNVKFIWFEEVKKDSKKVIEELCEFLGHPLPQEKIDALVEHVSFDKMKKNTAVNPSSHIGMTGEKNFMRKGKVGDWKNFFSGELEEKFHTWVKQNVERTGIKLPQS